MTVTLIDQILTCVFYRRMTVVKQTKGIFVTTNKSVSIHRVILHKLLIGIVPVIVRSTVLELQGNRASESTEYSTGLILGVLTFATTINICKWADSARAYSGASASAIAEFLCFTPDVTLF